MTDPTAPTQGRSVYTGFGDRLVRQLLDWEPTPGIITALYLVLAFIGLYVSDVWLVRHISNPTLLKQLQAFKGGAEIALTAGFILVLTRRSRHHLQGQNRRLRRAQEDLSILHRILRHNLRNDINVIDGYVGLAREALPEEEAGKYCDHIRGKIQEIIQYVEKATKINKVTGAVDSNVELDVSSLVAPAASNYGDREAVTITVDVPESAAVSAHPLINDAIVELVENALVHNDSAQPEVSVTVSSVSDAGDIAIRIADNGPGMPEVEHRTFAQHRENQLTHSLGMGLWLVYWTVYVSGGSFEIAEQTEGGCVVTVRLPAA